MSSRGVLGNKLLCAYILLYANAAHASILRKGAVVIEDGHSKIVEDERADAVAVGSFQSSQGTKSGWAQLYIETRGGSDHEQMRAAGYLEGFLTAYEISAHYLNMKSFFDIKTEAPAQWLLEQDEWSRGQVASNETAFWSTLGLLLEQHTGMMEGYWAAANQSLSTNGKGLPYLTIADFLKLSAVGRLSTAL
jgi:hypothetical protein